MRLKRIFFLSIILSALLLGIGIIYALLSQYVQIPSSGRLNAVGVRFFSDKPCTLPISAIVWGNITLGETKTQVFYAKNIQSVNSILNMTVSGWNPSGASSHLIASWNYTGAVIIPNQVVPIRFSLAVSSSTTGIGTFSFLYNIGMKESP